MTVINRRGSRQVGTKYPNQFTQSGSLAMYVDSGLLLLIPSSVRVQKCLAARAEPLSFGPNPTLRRSLGP